VFKSLGNLNTNYGLPLTVARMIMAGARPEDFDFAVLEMGMSSYGEIKRLTEIAPPAVAVVGNVGAAHIEFFGTTEAIAEAKAELVDGLKPGGTAVLNADDPLVIRMRERRPDVLALSFGIDARADVMASRIEGEDDLSGTRFQLTTPQGGAAVKLPLVGRHNVENILAAITVARLAGAPPAAVQAAIDDMAPLPHRLALVRERARVRWFDDSKATNVGAAAKSLESFAGPVILIAGGVDKGGGYDAVVATARGKVRLALVLGAARERIGAALAAGGVPVEHVPTLEAAVAAAADAARAGDTVLLAPACASFDMFTDYAARGRAFAAAVEALP
jgi:UDP-N-acetylmuramoylalanine--D-glutamate ligase